MPDPTPTPGDLARDLLADLTLCDAATPGPWYHYHPCEFPNDIRLRGARDVKADTFSA